MIETIVQIQAPHFKAGIIAQGGKVIDAAPIVKYMIGWDAVKVRDYSWLPQLVFKPDPSLVEHPESSYGVFCFNNIEHCQKCNS